MLTLSPDLGTEEVPDALEGTGCHDGTTTLQPRRARAGGQLHRTVSPLRHQPRPPTNGSTVRNWAGLDYLQEVSRRPQSCPRAKPPQPVGRLVEARRHRKHAKARAMSLDGSVSNVPGRW